MRDPLTAAQRQRLAVVRDREMSRFLDRVPGSLRLGERARRVMPSGVPMAWMAGLFRTPPVWVSHGEGARFTDVDGNSYLDFNICDMSAALGYAHPRLAEVMAQQAGRGVQFLLPVEPALAVCEQLQMRFGLSQWQFTLSASGANVEALRLARLATGREGILLFHGKYHGHLEQTLWDDRGSGPVPESLGLGAAPPPGLAVVDFNDLAAVEEVLSRRGTAAVLTEGVLTNCGTVLPDPDFMPGVRELCDRYGTLMIIDETHTQFDLYGGVTAHYGLRPDIVTGGKGIAGGVPIGTYGMTGGLAELMQDHLEDDAIESPGIATGGTLYANALSLRCAEVALSELMTLQEHQRIAGLGGHLADGIEQAAADHGLPWRAHRFGARSGYCLFPDLPRNAEQAHPSLDPLFTDTRRVYFANRGIWEAISTSGPHIGFAHTTDDVDTYLTVLDDYLHDLE